MFRLRDSLLCIVVLLGLLFWWGCSSSEEMSGGSSAPSNGEKVPAVEEHLSSAAGGTFDYIIQNENCGCKEYLTNDPSYPIRYRFKATYKMEGGIITSIEMEITNQSKDTLLLDRGTVTISSRNVEYQYNNKALPLPDMTLLPGDSETMNLDGHEVTDNPSWRKIAGEQMTLTLKGIKLGDNTLARQKITFVPENPHLKEDE